MGGPVFFVSYRQRIVSLFAPMGAVAAGVYLALIAIISDHAIKRAEANVLPVTFPNGGVIRSPLINASPVFLDEDSLMWVLHAENGLRERVWRVRYTYVDNVPLGREVHWSSPTTWF